MGPSALIVKSAIGKSTAFKIQNENKNVIFFLYFDYFQKKM